MRLEIAVKKKYKEQTGALQLIPLAFQREENRRGASEANTK